MSLPSRARIATARRCPAARLWCSGSSPGCACRGCCRRPRRACAPHPSRRGASRWRAFRAAAAGRRPSRPSRPCAGRAPALSPDVRGPPAAARGRSRRTRLLSARSRAPRPRAARAACRARRGRSGCARAAAAPRAADRAPGSPARRRPSTRWPPRAASRRPRPAAASSRRRAPAAADRASAVRAAAPPSPPPRRARAGWRRFPDAFWPDCARRRCRSISCCCRRASSFSFSTS